MGGGQGLGWGKSSGPSGGPVVQHGGAAGQVTRLERRRAAAKRAHLGQVKDVCSTKHCAVQILRERLRWLGGSAPRLQQAAGGARLGGEESAAASGGRAGRLAATSWGMQPHPTPPTRARPLVRVPGARLAAAGRAWEATGRAPAGGACGRTAVAAAAGAVRPGAPSRAAPVRAAGGMHAEALTREGRRALAASIARKAGGRQGAAGRDQTAAGEPAEARANLREPAPSGRSSTSGHLHHAGLLFVMHRSPS